MKPEHIVNIISEIVSILVRVARFMHEAAPAVEK